MNCPITINKNKRGSTAETDRLEGRGNGGGDPGEAERRTEQNSKATRSHRDTEIHVCEYIM